jgi:alpha-glucosidase (family GH31 glycosyl hydrolase)
MRSNCLFILLILFNVNCLVYAQPLIVAGRPSQLDIRKAGDKSLRITLKPVSYQGNFPMTPALTNRKYDPPVLSIKEGKTIKKTAGNFIIKITQSPLSVTVSDKQDHLIQQLTFNDDESLVFRVNDELLLGLGEGGSKPAPGVAWRELAVEYDRKGRYDSMQPRWQTDAYGSRNPVPMLIGSEGWGIFVASPWVQVDLRDKDKGIFIPRKTSSQDLVLQTVDNQWTSTAKGLPPIAGTVAGLYDLFVFDARDPVAFMKDFSVLTGPASMPPKWALGYMQSHRRLEDDKQMTGVVDTFRNKKIPIDAVIYLGTGFTPKGWNKKQPSFEFNPEVFKNEPSVVIGNMHSKQVKVVLHMVPWDRDKLPSLHGSIPPKAGEQLNASHIQQYWHEHIPLVKTGVDAFWPDEGDWFNLYERIKRHQLYYQGYLSFNPSIRPWSLQRNGYPGIAQWGGWVWSGDTESSWKSLEAQIAVGLNYSLSIGPYWGSDIGGFFPNEELTGELYARWFQFGAFCGSFRSHGVTWRTRLPWGWGGNDMSPKEARVNPLQSEMNNKEIEPVVKKYDELRYQLMPYTYTLAWEARNSGMPLMRALWLHYPKDKTAAKTADQFLWGRDLLIAPVYQKSASGRKIYLPEGEWYDWWTNVRQSGLQTISREVDLSVMPIYVKAGAIIPVDPVRQYTAEKVTEPTTLRIYSGENGSYTLYEDDGISMDYQKGNYALTQFLWNDAQKKLTIQPQKAINGKQAGKKIFRVQLIPQGISKEVIYSEKKTEVIF